MKIGPLKQPVIAYQWRILDDTRNCDVLSLNAESARIDFAKKKMDLVFRVDVSGDFLQAANRKFQKGQNLIIETMTSNASKPVETMMFTIKEVEKSEMKLDYASPSDILRLYVELEFSSVIFPLVNKD